MLSVIAFFDDYWMDARKQVHRRYFKPALMSTYTDPQYGTSVYASIHWCPESGVYRTWYEVVPDLRVNALRYLAVAESPDGLTWSSPTWDPSLDEATVICPRLLLYVSKNHRQTCGNVHRKRIGG